jgi:hypothetical protein
MQMNRFLRNIALISTAPVFAALVCIPPEPPLPAKLAAPVFTYGSVVIEQFDGIWQEMIRLSWQPPDSNADAVSEYLILVELPFDTTVDSLSLLQTEPQRIPGFKTEAFQLTGDIRMFTQDSLKVTLYYRICAIDSLDRTGDTSSAFGVSLLKKVDMLSPLGKLDTNRFVWEFTGIADEIFSSMMVWGPGDSLPFFKSDTSSAFGFIYDPLRFAVSLPDTSLPLPTGNYTWTVRTELKQPPPGAISYTTGIFNVP